MCVYIYNYMHKYGVPRTQKIIINYNNYNKQLFLASWCHVNVHIYIHYIHIYIHVYIAGVVDVDIVALLYMHTYTLIHTHTLR